MDAASQLCVGCHRDVEAQLTYPSHHPVAEGGLSCLSCHDPHEDRRVSAIDPNRRCGSCHQDFEGPWIFEHPPVVEGCTTCHNPHGAVGDDLLEVVQPAICLSCHTLNDAWHHDPVGSGILDNTTISEDNPRTPTERIIVQEAQLFFRRCTDCHGAVHGSYTDEHLRH
jgi:DmsE family decaheme c-type cytochrome